MTPWRGVVSLLCLVFCFVSPLFSCFSRGQAMGVVRFVQLWTVAANQTLVIPTYVNACVPASLTDVQLLDSGRCS